MSIHLWNIKGNPALEADYMLPRLEQGQRDFICRMKPTLKDQRIHSRDFSSVWPSVETGDEDIDQIWFGGLCGHYPEGRPPVGNKRSRYSFRFYEAGLLLREKLLAGARR